jgi:hypothetical protein
MRRLAVAILLLVVLGLIVVVATGAFHIGSSEDTINVTIDKKQLKQEAQRGAEEAREAGTKLLHRTGEALEKADGKIRSTRDNQDSLKVPEKAPTDVEREPAKPAIPGEGEQR